MQIARDNLCKIRGLRGCSPSSVHRICSLRRELVDLFVAGERRDAGDYRLFGESDERQRGRGQHVELGGERRDEHRDLPRHFHFDSSDRFDEREPHGNHDLYTDGYECRRVGDVDGNRYCEHDGEADHQFVHSQPGHYKFRVE
jgi:hypothetical protein